MNRKAVAIISIAENAGPTGNRRKRRSAAVQPLHVMPRNCFFMNETPRRIVRE